MNLLMKSLLLLILIPFGAQAELFQNSYVSFELPPNWKCSLDKTEWTCSSKFEKNTKEAIIILTAKEAGPSDSLKTYEAHLKQPKTVNSGKGQAKPSKVLSVKKRQIANHTWVDGLHLGSEINSYYTRYVATVKDRLAIAITFSAHKAHYTKYSNDFLKSVKSLKLVASKDLLGNRPNLAVRGDSETFGAAQGIGLPMLNDPELPPEPQVSEGMDPTQLIAILLILAAVGVFLWRKKKK